MDLFFSSKKIFIFGLFVTYFIQIVVGPPKLDPAEPSYSVRVPYFKVPRQKECFTNIHTHFRISIEERSNVLDQYFKHAILYLRYVTEAEENVYKNGLRPEEKPSPFLLYNGANGSFITDEFAYKYYQHMEKQYVPLELVITPKVYCMGDNVCLSVLEQFGFVGSDATYLIEHAFSNIVLHDIKSADLPPGINPIEKNQATLYLEIIAGSAVANPKTIDWPEIFCTTHYQ